MASGISAAGDAIPGMRFQCKFFGYPKAGAVADHHLIDRGHPLPFGKTTDLGTNHVRGVVGHVLVVNPVGQRTDILGITRFSIADTQTMFRRD
jgi:hypothetical protein